MRFPERWLRSMVDPALDSDRLAHLLSMAGLEVEESAAAAPPFDGVVVAQVLSVARHPGAERLSVCQVDAGAAQPVQIVCGAPNVQPGIRVPCALPGASLPGGGIGAATVRGVESRGMLCSARELGLSEDAGGLMLLPADAPLGRSLREYLDLDERVFLLKVTPNRGDCLGILGLAREVAALTGAPLAEPRIAAASVGCDDRVPVRIEAPDLCGRFSGRVVRGVDARAVTPAWMRSRLERCGQRSISALVDISNYVMLELGRPNHLFDRDRIRGGLVVRWARDGERLRLLNGQTVELAADVGVIADEAGVESLAGIMGGEESSCTPETRNVYVEAAFWWPQAVQGRSRRYGFASEAGHRFERGVDFAGTAQAVERVTELVLSICGGTAGPLEDRIVHLPERAPVRLRAGRASRLLGVEVGEAEARQALERLGCTVVAAGADLLATPPSWRFDLSIEPDLIEEVARLRGYDSVPVRPPVAPMVMLPVAEGGERLARLRARLAARGYQEAITYSFVDEQWERDLAGAAAPVALANPIAVQMGVMRSTLFGGLLDALRSNLNRRQTRVRLFEAGRCFVPDGGSYRQPCRIAGLASGSAHAEQWGVPARAVDFHDVKGDLEALLAPLRVVTERSAHPALHPGRSARVLVDGVDAGVLGELHPRWQQLYELPGPAVLFELEVERLPLPGVPRPAPVSRFPAVRRDLAVILDESTSAQRILDAFGKQRPDFVTEIEVFDQYAGEGIEKGKKSLAFRVLLQDTEKTLTDEDADRSVAQLIHILEKQFHGLLRRS
jgi:phenylalanyl-tRNA synthetase beta chain